MGELFPKFTNVQTEFNSILKGLYTMISGIYPWDAGWFSSKSDTLIGKFGSMTCSWLLNLA